MKLFSSVPASDKLVAVFDVSSGSIGGALIRYPVSKTEKPEVIASHRVYVQYRHTIEIERLLEDLAKALAKVLKELQKAGMQYPEYVQVILASPWFMSQTRAILYKKSEPFVFTEKLLNTLVDREIAYVLEHDMETFGSFGAKSKIVERQLSLVKLNGYVTHEPFGRHATEAALYLTITLTPDAVLSRLKQVIKEHYHQAIIGFTTTAYTTFIAYRDSVETKHQLVLVDVGEEATDVAFVKDDLFLYQHSFPVGTNALCRLLIDKKSCSLAEAESLLAAYRNNHLATDARERIGETVTAFRNAWQEGMQTVLQTGHFGINLPETIVMVADPRYDLLLTEALKTDPNLVHRIALLQPEIHFLSEEVFNYPLNGVSVDIPLAIAALFAGRQVYL